MYSTHYTGTDFPDLPKIPAELEVPELIVSPCYATSPCYLPSHTSHTSPHTVPQVQYVTAPQSNNKQWRRQRTVFTKEELAVLESVYAKHKFLTPQLKAEVLSRVNVPSNVLVMWFQNKRSRDRAAGMVIEQ